MFLEIPTTQYEITRYFHIFDFTHDIPTQNSTHRYSIENKFLLVQKIFRLPIKRLGQAYISIEYILSVPISLQKC